MTEKRFKVAVYDDKAIMGFAVLDLEKPDSSKRLGYEIVYIDSREGCEIVCDFGNNLVDENEQLKQENWVLIHFFEQVYYDYMISCGADNDKELNEMSVAFQSHDLREIIRYCIGANDKEKLNYYSKLYKVDLQ